MRPDLIRTMLIKCYDELLIKMFDPNIEIHSVLPLNQENMLLMYRDLAEARIPDKTTNVIIASYTTAYARMELYKYMDMIGADRIYYHDTDSIIYSYKEGQTMIPTGTFLGEMTDELETYGPGSYIIEFVSGGPKNYSYKVYSPTKNMTITVVKVKGITLNYENTQVLDFDLMKKMIDGIITDPVIFRNDCIRRTKRGDVYTVRIPKSYRFNYTKRQKCNDDYKTLPYGY